MKWNVRFGFFWYNDEEIFKFSQDDYDKKAASFADAGINIVITFSCTHFRWSFRPYWSNLNRTLANIVEACHKYGIRVVEHHSSHLTYNPMSHDDWEYMESLLNRRGSSIDSWNGLREYVLTDPDIYGKPISSFRQIDGRTGKWARTAYSGYAMCFNNPYYRSAYSAYLEEVYKTGIDGIMADDVQWFGGHHQLLGECHACACEHCSSLFHEQTGYRLPEPGEEWSRFFANYDQPAYIAWEKFRRNAAAEFHHKVNRHFEGLGLNLIRPQYVSTALLYNPTGYAFDIAASLWDWVFQENTFASIIRYSWPMYAMEAVHRYALGRKHQIPSMSLFYPHSEDSFYFTWALAQSWGQLYTATAEGADLLQLEKKFRLFEKEHRNLFENQQKQADVAFYFSLKTRDYVERSAIKNMNSLVVWMQAAYFTNQAFDMVFENDVLETLEKYPVIVLPHVSMLSDDEMLRIRQYAANGGTLVITGMPGERNEYGSKRSPEEVASILGVDAVPSLDSIQRINKGKIHWITSFTGLLPAQGFVEADRMRSDKARAKAADYVVNHIKEGPGEVLEAVVSDRLLQTRNCPEEWIVSCFRNSEDTGYVIHILNAGGTLKISNKEFVSHDDPIPGFTAASEERINLEGLENSLIDLRWSNDAAIEKVMLYTPEKDYGIDLRHELRDSKLHIAIPLDAFTGYAVIELAEMP